MSALVKSLKIYPLKSAQGLEVDEMAIDELGPQYDREWMLIDDKNRFITQRTERRLVMIKPVIDKSILKLSVDSAFFSNPHFPPTHIKSYPSLDIPLAHDGDENMKVKIFDQECGAHHISPIYDQWFSDLLGKNIKLVRSPLHPQRTTSGRHGPKVSLRFPDGYPFLLITESTLNELSEKWGETASADRFRPNIVIENTSANEEESWKEFRINDVEFESVKKCTRCVIIDVDPKTGHKMKALSPVLKTYRMQDQQIVFGINLIHKNSGIIKKSSILKF